MVNDEKGNKYVLMLYSSLAYRAPELFNVPSQSIITTATDIWSLGCLFYAMVCAGYSPFECEFKDNGEIRFVDCTYLRVLGKWHFPPHLTIPTPISDLIR